VKCRVQAKLSNRPTSEAMPTASSVARRNAVRRATTSVRGSAVRTTATPLSAPVVTATYIISAPTDSLTRVAQPKPLLRAWTTSGRSQWFSIVCGSRSESARTAPPAAINVVRTWARSRTRRTAASSASGEVDGAARTSSPARTAAVSRRRRDCSRDSLSTRRPTVTPTVPATRRIRARQAR